MHLAQQGTKMTKIKLSVLTTITAGKLLAVSGCVKVLKYKSAIVKSLCCCEENTRVNFGITTSEILQN